MKNDKILVDGINLAKKHVKPNPNKNETGGIVEKEMPIHSSKAMIYNVKTKKPDRVGILKLKNNNKIKQIIYIISHINVIVNKQNINVVQLLLVYPYPYIRDS